MLSRFTDSGGFRKMDRGFKSFIEPIEYWLVAT